MKNKITYLFLFFGLLILLFLLMDRVRGIALNDVGKELGLKFSEGGDFRISIDMTRAGGDKSYRSLEAMHGQRLLKIEVTTGVTEKQAEQLVEERISLVQSLFNNIPSPYPGAVTNKVEVTAKFLPQVRKVKVGEFELPLYLLVSNARHTYGVMPEELAVNRGGVFFLYLGSRQSLYRFDYFAPANDFREEELVSFIEGIRILGDPARKIGVVSKSDAGSSALKIVPGGDGGVDTSLKRAGQNLIIIAFEPLGANHIGSYGYAKNTTPNLDTFAAEAFFFENAVSPSSWSLPVFMSWFTSLYPSRHGVVNKYSRYSEKEKVIANLAELSPSAITLAKVLKDNGYRTVAFTGGSSLDPEYGFAQGFDEYHAEESFGGFDATMVQGLDWLIKNHKEKFFLFIQGYDVHGKYPLKREHLGRFLGKPYQGPSKATEEEYWALRDRNLESGEITLPAEEIRLLKAVYDAKIYEADRRFGEFTARLHDLGLFENTVIVVSSGSGNEYLEHGRIDHGHSLYEELIHVPLLIRIPGAKNRRIPELVRTVDLMPTVIDTLNVDSGNELKARMQGVSLLPLMSGETMALDAVSETDYLNRSFKKSLKTNDGWKFIVSLDSEKRELYNLNEDPHEIMNVISQQPRLAYEMEQKLFRILKSE